MRIPILLCMLSAVLAKEPAQVKPEIESDPKQNHQEVRSVKPSQYFITPRPKFTTTSQITYQTPQPYSQYKFLTQDSQQYYQVPQYQFLPQNQNYVYQAPQYLYVQPYATNSVPQVAPGKPGIQYVMYMDRDSYTHQNPSAAALLQQSHNYAGLLQKNAYTNVLPANYQSPPPRTYAYQIPALRYQSQGYVQQPTVSQYLAPQQAYTDTRFLVPGVTYVHKNQDKPFEPVPPPIRGVPYLEKHQPQSLLDSYIPSVVQIQYWKQLQAAQNANSITQLDKLPQGNREIEKYAPPRHNTHFNYQTTYSHAQ